MYMVGIVWSMGHLGKKCLCVYIHACAHPYILRAAVYSKVHVVYEERTPHLLLHYTKCT